MPSANEHHRRAAQVSELQETAAQGPHVLSRDHGAVERISQAPSPGELAVLTQPHPTYPSADEAVKAGYEAGRVYRIEHLESWNKEQSTKLYFWRGFHDGYGWSGDGTPPLFCSLSCGLSFGVVCWHAGMRIKETPSDPATSTPLTPNKDNRNAKDSVV